MKESEKIKTLKSKNRDLRKQILEREEAHIKDLHFMQMFITRLGLKFKFKKL